MSGPDCVPSLNSKTSPFRTVMKIEAANEQRCQKWTTVFHSDFSRSGAPPHDRKQATSVAIMN